MPSTSQVLPVRGSCRATDREQHLETGRKQRKAHHEVTAAAGFLSNDRGSAGTAQGDGECLGRGERAPARQDVHGNVGNTLTGDLVQRPALDGLGRGACDLAEDVCPFRKEVHRQVLDDLDVAPDAQAKIDQEGSRVFHGRHCRIEFRRHSDKVPDVEIADLAREHLGPGYHGTFDTGKLDGCHRALAIPDPQMAIARLALKHVGDRGRKRFGFAQRIEFATRQPGAQVRRQPFPTSS